MGKCLRSCAVLCQESVFTFNDFSYWKFDVLTILIFLVPILIFFSFRGMLSRIDYLNVERQFVYAFTKRNLHNTTNRSTMMASLKVFDCLIGYPLNLKLPFLSVNSSASGCLSVATVTGIESSTFSQSLKILKRRRNREAESKLNVYC